MIICSLSINSLNAQSFAKDTIVMGNPIDIENGSGYLRNYYINYNILGIGIGEHGFLKAGFGIGELFDRKSNSYIVQPSISIPINTTSTINIGITIAQFTNTLINRTVDVEISKLFLKSKIQAGFSIGNIDTDISEQNYFDTNLSFKLNYSSYLSSKSLILIENRTFNKLYFTGEDDYLGVIEPYNTSKSEIDFLTMITYRYLSKKAGFDIGIIAVYDIPNGNDYVIPHLGFVLPFNRFTE